ncbi:DUF2169 domain-containing protein [Paraburkholderia agricolaris]|uniref:DUF2169 family type VI secretion system accessory protein n=1 Tax=Paraburkholderia agricolaris TaxID=2152888 RepID=UPI0038BC7E4C
MRIDKPDEPLVLLHHGEQAGRPCLTVTVGYMSRFDGALMREQQAWQALVARFAGQPFDEGVKKARGTFAVAGAACAPRGETVTSLIVSARFAQLRKRLAVFGDRSWRHSAAGWLPGDPQPFTRMPVDLAHAYGGPGWQENPAGRGHAQAPHDWARVPLPNVEWIDALCVAPSSRPQPATLAMLPGGVPARAQWLGDIAAHLRARRGRGYPADIDLRYFDAVAQDQCATGYFAGDETFAVEGMNERAGIVEGALPCVRPRLLWRAATQKEDAADVSPVFESRLDLDTVWLFPNDEQVLCLYRACWPVTDIDADDVGALHIVTERLADAPATTARLAERWRETTARRAVAAPTQVAAPTPVLAPDSAAAPVDDAPTPRAESAWAEHLASHQRVIEQFSAQPGAHPLLAELPAPDRAAFDALRAKQPGAPHTFTREAFDARLRVHLEQAGLPGSAVQDMSGAGGASTPSMALADLPAQLEALPPAQRAVVLEQWHGIGAMPGTAAQRAVTAAAALAAHPAKPAPSAQPVIDKTALLARLAKGEPVRGIRMKGQCLAGLDLGGLDFTDSVFEACDFSGARLAHVHLTNARLNGCDLSNAGLAQTSARRAYLTDCKLDAADLAASDWQVARWERCTAIGATLRDADLSQATLRDVALTRVEAAGLRASRVSFDSCRLDDADFSAAALSRSTFAHCDVDRLRLQSAELDGAQWRTVRGADLALCSARLANWRVWGATLLPGADFTGANLCGASLRDSSLVKASLRNAVLDQAVVLGCDLSGTDGTRLSARGAQFTGSRFTDARWRGANLMGASLRKTHLANVDFEGSNLYGVRSRGATIAGVRIERALTSRCELLETLPHE